jgi:ribosomal-protein-alanine N-acetyltransferase
MNPGQPTVIVRDALPSADLDSFARRCAAQQRLYLETAGVEPASRRLSDELSALVPERLFLVCHHEDGGLQGIAVLDALPWDSVIYEMKMGKVSHLLAIGTPPASRAIKRQLIAELVEQARHQGFRHLMSRVSASDRDGIHALECGGFRSMDVQVTLACRRPLREQTLEVANNLKVVPFSPRDLPALQELSAHAYQESRLFSDPNLPAHATEQLHRKWIENDCQGRAAQVLVASLDGQLAGYIACLLHPARERYGVPMVGDIDLIAVAPSYRGRGVAAALVKAAVSWLSEKAEMIVVKTQVTNYPALALYQRHGFFLREAQMVLHRFEQNLPNNVQKDRGVNEC